MIKRRTAGLFVLLAVVIAGGVTFTLVSAFSRPTHRLLWQECQPATVSYDDFDPYCLSVVEGDVNWVFMPLNPRRHAYLFVARGTAVPGYGHYLDYGPQLYGDPERYLSDVTLDWTAEGITFNEPTGHRLFIPAEQFTGGR